MPAAYLSLVHQRGTVTLMDVLASEAHSSPDDMSVLFLMPCHSTPYYSHVHQAIPMAFLDCSPPGFGGPVGVLNGCSGEKLEQSPGLPTPLSCSPFLTRSSEFLDSPEAFVRGLLSSLPTSVLPSHIAMFDGVQPMLQKVLGEYGYRQATQLFHSHVAVDQNGLQSSVVLFSTREHHLAADVCDSG